MDEQKRMHIRAFLLISLSLMWIAIGTIFILWFVGDNVACSADQVSIGMSEDDLLAKCGKPISRNYATNGSTQWVYRGSESLYVYTDDGKVKSKQWTK